MTMTSEDPTAAPAWRFVRQTLWLYGGLVLALGMVLVASLRSRAGLPVLAELARSGVVSLPLGALLLGFGGLAGSAMLARARLRGEPRGISRAARLPQAVLVPVLALAGAWVAWRLRSVGGTAIAPASLCYALGAAAIALSFPLLIVERLLAAPAASCLPEAADLRGLATIGAAMSFLAGLVELAAGFGVPFTGKAMQFAAFLVALVGVELAARALGKLFLPPPEPRAARAACRSVVAQIMSAGPRERGFGAPVRAHFGIDFSRSWALAYVARVFWPMLAGLGVLAWGLTGVVLVPMENRAIYERFGAPVRVLHPGLHLVLPWPLGATRRQDFGAVHALALAGPSAVAATLPRAEDLAPPEADRLWETAHPGEVTLAIASASGAKQSFQSVSADIRLLYRVGLSDAQAVAASYSTADPEALVQAVGGRVVAAYYADRTLDLVLGARREAMAEQLRAAMQAELDAMGAGLEMVAVVIEAIHPPAGAAEAYHFVRAAEIQAQASIASERGNAIVIRSQSAQYAATQVDAARATAAETLGAAQTTLARFTADRDAAKAGGRAFLLERYFTDLSGALARAPKTIIDHRLNWPEAPVLDLRPLAGERPTTGNGE